MSCIHATWQLSVCDLSQDDDTQLLELPEMYTTGRNCMQAKAMQLFDGDGLQHQGFRVSIHVFNMLTVFMLCHRCCLLLLCLQSYWLVSPLPVGARHAVKLQAVIAVS